MSFTHVKEVLPMVFERIQGCPTPTAINAYIDAARQFCNESHWLRSDVTGVATAADIGQYALGNDPYQEVVGIRAISVERSSTDWRPLTERAQTLMDVNESHSTPELYAYIPEGQFRLHPVPNAVLNLRLTVFVQPKRGAVHLDSTLLVNWERALRYGALANLYELDGQPWGNPAKAERNRLLFNTAIASASNAAVSGFNPGSAATDRPGGPNGRARLRIQVL